ncbi:hypothetical protein EB061_10500 [bacterium]|nr:hypothetical protein [bacterium]
MGDHDNDDDEMHPKERSAVATNIESLQATVRRLAEERDVLPQPLFWSLFHSRLASIKKQKEISRVVSEVLVSHSTKFAPGVVRYIAGSTVPSFSFVSFASFVVKTDSVAPSPSVTSSGRLRHRPGL